MRIHIGFRLEQYGCLLDIDDYTGWDELSACVCV